MMNAFYLYGFLIGIVITLLNGGWVVTSSVNRLENRIWALLSLCVAVWFCGRLLIMMSANEAQAMLWQRVMYAGAIFLNVVYFDFVRIFLDKKKYKKFVHAGYGIAATLCVLNLVSHSFVSGMRPAGSFHFYENPGPLYFIHVLLYMIYPGAGFALLLNERRIVQGFRRNQIHYLIAASIIGFACGITSFPMVFGFAVAPIGAPFVWVYVVIVSYAIVKHRLLDITVIIRKTLIYSVVTATLTLFYLGIVAVFTRVFAGLTGYQTMFSSTVAALLITSCFQPLRKRVQGFVDGKFFRQYVDREEKLYELSREVITHTTPEAMAQSLIRVLRDTLHPKSAVLYLKVRDGGAFSLISQDGAGEVPELMPENNSLANYFMDHPQPFVQQNLATDGGEPLDTRQPSRKEGTA